jgi:hypothetical protein
MNPRAREVKDKSPHHLIVSFTNDERKLFDLKPYLRYPIYEKLQDEVFCSSVKVQNGIVVWDEETDLASDWLYLESEPIDGRNL